MRRHVALLRGVSPMNARMPELKRCFERAGFTNVRTLLSSGNVVFDAAAKSEAGLVRKAEAAMAAELGRRFEAFVRTQAALQELVAADPFGSMTLPYELGTPASFDYTGMNGRGLMDNVLDNVLSVLTNYPLGAGVAPDPARITAEFPYFSCP